jgi:hypothetical protein
MGITIHYRFMVKDRNAVLQLLKKTKEMAVKLGMKIIQDTETYLVIHPHPGSETINLHFSKWSEVKKIKDWDYCRETMSDYEKVISDNDYVCSSFTKTQYAGFKTHVVVAEILRKVASRCTLAYVEDEADYYETGNIQKAAENFDSSSKMISKVAGMLKEAFGSENVYCAIDNTSNGT